MRVKRILLSLALIGVLSLDLILPSGGRGATSDSADLALPDKRPLLTLACISDLHTDYGLQSQAPYIRNSVAETLRRIGEEEKADLLLVGGDNTSDNAKLAVNGGWSKETYQKVLDTYESLVEEAVPSGRSLWACGNHDNEAGKYDNYDAYAGYEAITDKHCSEPISVFRQKDDRTLAEQWFPEHILGAHYNESGFDFIILNPPYGKMLTYTNQTLSWLRKRLAAIGPSKTVFLVTHYPLSDMRGMSTPGYGLQKDAYKGLMNVLKKYPNVIYLYGHNHGGAESVYISQDTFERITSYTADGTPVHDRNAVPTSFISSFMGSMSYYNYSLEPYALTEEDPFIVQALMIYVYDDRIVFQMKNYGTDEGHATRVLEPWTVMRDVGGSLIPQTDPLVSTQTSTHDQPSSYDQTSQNNSGVGIEDPLIIALVCGGGVLLLGGTATAGIMLFRKGKKK